MITVIRNGDNRETHKLVDSKEFKKRKEFYDYVHNKYNLKDNYDSSLMLISKSPFIVDLEKSELSIEKAKLDFFKQI